mgnify:CR=1 FL=1
MSEPYLLPEPPRQQCTTCDGRGFVTLFGKKTMFRRGKPDVKAVVCPTCHGKKFLPYITK